MKTKAVRVGASKNLRRKIEGKIQTNSSTHFAIKQMRKIE